MYNPTTNSWTEIPTVPDDGEFDYTHVRHWYYHKGHRSWGYGDDGPGYHPQPWPRPSKLEYVGTEEKGDIQYVPFWHPYRWTILGTLAVVVGSLVITGVQ